MKKSNIQQQITETLEACLSKMSQKLKSNFDPDDKQSLKLLQHYRSTLNSFRSWLKQTGEAINETFQEVKTAASNTFHKTKNGTIKKKEAPQSKYEMFIEQEKNKSKAPITPQSGLHYKPAKA